MSVRCHCLLYRIRFQYLSFAFFSFSFFKFFIFFYSVQRYIFPLDCLFLPRHLLCCSETLARSRAYSTGTNPFSMRWSRWRRTDDRVMAEMRRDGRDFEEVCEENKNKRNHKREVGIGDITERKMVPCYETWIALSSLARLHLWVQSIINVIW